MSLIQTLDRIVEYPESDGKPTGETDLHRDWMVRILEILRYRYRGQRVYVASDLIVYYEQGDPTKFVVPDIFLVKDCDPGRRRTFKIWEEGKAPTVAFEVTSLGSRREDQIFKPQIYSRLGILEYFAYDPTGDYLDPPLQGFRLEQATYRRVERIQSELLKCHALGITLGLKMGDLVLQDLQTGETLLTEAEASGLALKATQAERDAVQAERDSAQAEREKERAARQAAEARIAELEADLQRLRNESKHETDA